MPIWFETVFFKPSVMRLLNLHTGKKGGKEGTSDLQVLYFDKQGPIEKLSMITIIS